VRVASSSSKASSTINRRVVAVRAQAPAAATAVAETQGAAPYGVFRLSYDVTNVSFRVGISIAFGGVVGRGEREGGELSLPSPAKRSSFFDPGPSRNPLSHPPARVGPYSKPLAVHARHSGHGRARGGRAKRWSRARRRRRRQGAARPLSHLAPSLTPSLSPQQPPIENNQQEDPGLTRNWNKTVKIAVTGASGNISNHLLFMVRFDGKGRAVVPLPQPPPPMADRSPTHLNPP
jgi:hypothetical protein